MNKRTTQPQRERGAALLIFVIFFLIASTILVFGIGRGVYDDLVTYRTLLDGKQSFAAAEAGIEDAIYRHRKVKNYSNAHSFSIGSTTVFMTRTLVIDSFIIVAHGIERNAVRKSEVKITVGDGASFNFGLQSGNGGIALSNNSKIYGNVFSNGIVSGQGNATVYGDIISAGSTGLIQAVQATGSVWAHNLNSVTVGKDAYYFATSTRIATVVSGISFPGSTDQATATLPIKDEEIEKWKTDIATTGTIIASTSVQCSSGTYTIDTDTTLNNVKIECNVIMKKQGASTNITIAGPIWIQGNLAFSQGPTIIASSALGGKSIAIIVDNPSNRATSSKVSVNQSTTFNSGSTQSYVVIISMNNSAETGGSEKAIDLAQSANGKILVYASHGLVAMGNSISLKEVTAYQIEVNNGATIIYESGLMSLLFSSGPGGGYVITSWKEIR